MMHVMRDDPTPREARAAERRNVGIRAQLREMGGGKLDVDVQDLSVTGFRVDSVYRVALGATVFLTIPTFTAMEATVAWAHKSGYGCQFVNPLHPAVFDMITRRFGGSS
jgi:hypothetical protein